MTDISKLHQAQDSFLSKWGVPPPMSGRGIVTSLYDKEFVSGYVQLREMARLGVTLPIQIWYRPGELSDAQIAIIDNLPLNISFHHLLDKDVHPWATKMFAIYRSDFEEVMWIDTDNVPIRNPEFLFDDPEYKAKGSLFWRDVSGVDRARLWHPEAPVWPVMRVPYNDCEEFEAGQFLINKTLCWEALGLALHFNINHSIYYDILHFGDKDTFRFAFQHLDFKKHRAIQQVNYLQNPNPVPFGMMPFGPFHIGAPNPWHKWGGGSVMQQRDRYGKPLFNHRSVSKYTLNQADLDRYEAEYKAYGPAEEAIYLEHLRELKKLLG